MKNYLKHLKENPLKIVWLSFIYLFTGIMASILICSKDTIIEDNNIFIYVALCVFIATIFIIANYQPYKEYKDGL